MAEARQPVSVPLADWRGQSSEATPLRIKASVKIAIRWLLLIAAIVVAACLLAIVFRPFARQQFSVTQISAHGRLDVTQLHEQVRGVRPPAVVLIDLGPRDDRFPEFAAWYRKQVVDEVSDRCEPAVLIAVAHEILQTIATIDLGGTVADVIQGTLAAPNDRWTWYGDVKSSCWSRIDWSDASTDVTPAVSPTGSSPTGSQPVATADNPAAAVPSRPIHAAVPSLALVPVLRAAGRTPRSIDTLAELESGIERILSPGTSEADAARWLATPPASTAMQDELVWARRVLASGLNWKLKSRLIANRVLANRLATRVEPRKHFSDRWTTARARQRAAETTLLCPVRIDHVASIDAHSAAAQHLITQLQSAANRIDSANVYLRHVFARLEKSVSRPVLSASIEGDWTIRWLRECRTLQRRIRGDGDDVMLDASLRQLSQLDAAEPTPTSESPADRATDVMATDPIAATLVRLERVERAAALLDREVGRSLTGAVRRATDALGQDAAASTSRAAIDRVEREFADAIASTIAGQSAPPDDVSTLTSSIRGLAGDCLAEASVSIASRRDVLRDQYACYERLLLELDAISPAWKPAPVELIAATRDLPVGPDGRPRMKVSLEVRPTRMDQGHIQILYDREVCDLDLPRQSPVPAERIDVHESETDAAHSDADPAVVSVTPRSPRRLEWICRANGIEWPTVGESSGRLDLDVRWVGGDDTTKIAVPLPTGQGDLAEITLTDVAPPVEPAIDTPAPVEPAPVEPAPVEPAIDTPAIDTPVPDASTDDRAILHWPMRASQTHLSSIRIRGLDPATKRVAVRLLASPELLALNRTLPVDMLARHATWRNEATELATIPEVLIDHQHATHLPFPAVKLKPKQPPVALATLLIELTDLASGAVQCTTIRPTVRRPSTYVRPKLSFNARESRLSIQLTGPDDVGAESIPVRLVVTHPSMSQPLAESTFAWHPDEPITRHFNLAAATHGEAIVRVDVDRWPSSFRFRLPTDVDIDDLPIDDRSMAVSIINDASPIVNGRTNQVAASVALDIADEAFAYGHDRVTLGLDLNGDRRLTDEPTVTVTSPVDRHFRFAGISSNGKVAVTAEVVPPRMTVESAEILNLRTTLLAVASRGDQIAYSPARDVIFDSTPPKIGQVTIESPVPVPVGPPLEFLVEVVDDGLSPITGVFAAIAPPGQIDWTADLKPIPAVPDGTGRWRVSIPTAKRIPGRYPILIRATDDAGNLGPPHPVDIRMWSADAIERRRESQTTAVRGRVLYVDRGVAQLSLSLVPIPPGNAPSGGQIKPPKPTHTTQTDTRGRFLIGSVPAGRYRMKIEGQYRGTTVRREAEMEVSPPWPTTLADIRID